MAIELLITEEGYRTMLFRGLATSITKFSINDQYKIYGLNTDHTLPPLSGTKPNLGNSNPAFNLAKYGGIPQNPLSNDMILSMSRRVGVKIFSEDCDGGFDVSTLNIKFHLARYFNNLTNLLSQPYTFNIQGLNYKIYDYTYALVEQENIVDGGYDIIDNIQMLDVNIFFNSETDKNNYLSLNNRYNVILSNGTPYLNDKRNATVYPSPFQLDFGVYNVGNIGVPGSNLSFGMMPDNFGYTIDGEFYTLSDANNLITSQGTNSFGSIIPTAVLKNTFYYLTTPNTLNTKDPLLGQFAYGYKTQNNSETLLEGLINMGKMYMKTKGSLIDGVYTLPINYKLKVNGTNEFNNIYDNNNYGGNVNINFIFDENDVTTTDIIEVF
jgi:hypothetical protein